MKKILQSVALALAAFLTVQPALATMTCAQKICADGSSSPDCCLPSSGASMPGMSAPGQAPSNPVLVGSGCASDPCNCTVSVRSTPLLADQVKSQADGAIAFARLGGLIAAPAPDRTTAVDAVAFAASRDRPVLFHVFRI